MALCRKLLGNCNSQGGVLPQAIEGLQIRGSDLQGLALRQAIGEFQFAGCWLRQSIGELQFAGAFPVHHVS